MEHHRGFFRSDFERLLVVLQEYMCYLNRTQAHFGVSPVSMAMAALVNWLRADAAGDYATASIDAAFEAQYDASLLEREWYDSQMAERVEVLNEYIHERNEQRGLNTPQKLVDALARRMDDSKRAEALQQAIEDVAAELSA